MLAAFGQEREHHMHFTDHIASANFALAEGSVYERLRRDPSIVFDPQIAHGGLIYDAAASKLLEWIHRDYLNVGQKYGMTMFALTDTWRCSKER
jgi:homocysteine S-methyltransferase